jgi:hypothetical protein
MEVEFWKGPRMCLDFLCVCTCVLTNRYSYAEEYDRYQWVFQNGRALSNPLLVNVSGNHDIGTAYPCQIARRSQQYL